MEISGKVIKVLPSMRFVSKKNGSEYVKHFFVLETGGQYPKKVCFSVLGDEKWEKYDIQVGGSYSVSFDIDSREWNGKWFNECVVWKVVSIDGGNTSNQPQSSAPQQSYQDPNLVF